MINSLYKKIACALMLSVQIIKPMEQQPLHVSKFCEQAFIAESLWAVVSIVSNLITSDITIPRDVWQKELCYKDKAKVAASICGGLFIGASFVKKSMNDNFKHLITICDRDCQELAFARQIIWWSVVASLTQQTAFIQRKAINQLKKEGQSEGDVTWQALVKQVKFSDLLAYVIGISLLMIFPTASAS